MKSEIKIGALEHLVHIPCQGEDNAPGEPAFMDELYEDPDNGVGITGFECVKCGYKVDLIPRNKRP